MQGDLVVASSQYDILLCSETLVSDLRHVSELLVPGVAGFTYTHTQYWQDRIVD